MSLTLKQFQDLHGVLHPQTSAGQLIDVANLISGWLAGGRIADVVADDMGPSAPVIAPAAVSVQWTRADIRKLTELVGQGRTAAQIAAVLDRSEQAVKVKCARLGLKSSVRALSKAAKMRAYEEQVERNVVSVQPSAPASAADISEEDTVPTSTPTPAAAATDAVGLTDLARQVLVHLAGLKRGAFTPATDLEIARAMVVGTEFEVIADVIGMDAGMVKARWNALRRFPPCLEPPGVLSDAGREALIAALVHRAGGRA